MSRARSVAGDGSSTGCTFPAAGGDSQPGLSFAQAGRAAWARCERRKWGKKGGNSHAWAYALEWGFFLLGGGEAQC